jgi:hypothetical protein
VTETNKTTEKVDDSVGRGRFWGALVATALLTLATSNGTTCAQTKQAAAEATAQTDEVDARVQRLYEENLAPVIEGLVKDAASYRKDREQLQEHLLAFAELKGQVKAIEGFQPSRYGTRYEQRRDEEVAKATSQVPQEEPSSSSAAVSVLEQIQRNVAEKKGRPLPSFRGQEDEGTMGSAAQQLQLPAYGDF